MNDLEKGTKRNWWLISFKIIQVIFFFTIIVCTVYNLCISIRQTSLIFKPVVGVTHVTITPAIQEGKANTYENVIGAVIAFSISNTGNLPAKNCKLKTVGKIGNTTLPYTETKSGGIVVQNAKFVNKASIGKDTIERLVEKEEELLYTLQFSYSDWEDYETYDYSILCEIFLIQKTPFKLGARMLLSE